MLLEVNERTNEWAFGKKAFLTAVLKNNYWWYQNYLYYLVFIIPWILSIKGVVNILL